VSSIELSYNSPSTTHENPTWRPSLGFLAISGFTRIDTFRIFLDRILLLDDFLDRRNHSVSTRLLREKFTKTEGYSCVWIIGPNTSQTTFHKQIKFRGITTSFAFVAEPQTNGVAERLNRTLKEQTLGGQVFRSVHGVRETMRT
jgi:hypothetical protein